MGTSKIEERNAFEIIYVIQMELFSGYTSLLKVGDTAEIDNHCYINCRFGVS